MKENISFESRDFIICRNEEKQIDGSLLVEPEPYNVIYLETAPVDYWFFYCIYKGQPMLLEQRIELTPEGSIVDETIRELPPYICSDVGKEIKVFEGSEV